MQHNVNFLRYLIGLNSEFSFSKSGCPTEVKELNLPNTSRWREKNWILTFSKVLHNFFLYMLLIFAHVVIQRFGFKRL